MDFHTLLRSAAALFATFCILFLAPTVDAGLRQVSSQELVQLADLNGEEEVLVALKEKQHEFRARLAIEQDRLGEESDSSAVLLLEHRMQVLQARQALVESMLAVQEQESELAVLDWQQGMVASAVPTTAVVALHVFRNPASRRRAAQQFFATESVNQRPVTRPRNITRLQQDQLHSAPIYGVHSDDGVLFNRMRHAVEANVDGAQALFQNVASNMQQLDDQAQHLHQRFRLRSILIANTEIIFETLFDNLQEYQSHIQDSDNAMVQAVAEAGGIKPYMRKHLMMQGTPVMHTVLSTLLASDEELQSPSTRPLPWGGETPQVRLENLTKVIQKYGFPRHYFELLDELGIMKLRTDPESIKRMNAWFADWAHWSAIELGAPYQIGGNERAWTPSLASRHDFMAQGSYEFGNGRQLNELIELLSQGRVDREGAVRRLERIRKATFDKMDKARLVSSELADSLRSLPRLHVDGYELRELLAAEALHTDEVADILRHFYDESFQTRIAGESLMWSAARFRELRRACRGNPQAVEAVVHLQTSFEDINLLSRNSPSVLMEAVTVLRRRIGGKLKAIFTFGANGLVIVAALADSADAEAQQDEPLLFTTADPLAPQKQLDRLDRYYGEQLIDDTELQKLQESLGKPN